MQNSRLDPFGWLGEDCGNKPAWGRRAGTPLGAVPAYRAFDPAPACFQMAILFKLLARYAKQILFRYGESFHYEWEQPDGGRQSEWFMGLEINISAAGPLSPISGDAREILSSQTGLLLPPPTAGNWGMAAACFGIPGINPANAAGRDEFRLNTFTPVNHAPPGPTTPPQQTLPAK
jgi:hypothetical protein